MLPLPQASVRDRMLDLVGLRRRLRAGTSIQMVPHRSVLERKYEHQLSAIGELHRLIGDEQLDIDDMHERRKAIMSAIRELRRILKKGYEP